MRRLVAQARARPCERVDGVMGEGKGMEISIGIYMFIRTPKQQSLTTISPRRIFAGYVSIT
jgi:hypothetical protein